MGCKRGDRLLRQGLTKRILPVSLDDNPRHGLRFPIPEGEGLSLYVCQLIEEYERIIQATKPSRTELVERSVLESDRLSARHLPLCPPPGQHKLLPADGIDCVACTLEFDVTAWSYASYVLRVHGNSNLIVAEVYLTAAPRAAGLIAMRIKGASHFISSIGSGQSSSTYRSRNPDSPSKVEHQEAKEKGERILHFVENALDLASSKLQELSAQARIMNLKGRNATAKLKAKPAVEVDSPADAVPTGWKKHIKRRGEEE